MKDPDYYRNVLLDELRWEEDVLRSRLEYTSRLATIGCGNDPLFNEYEQRVHEEAVSAFCYFRGRARELRNMTDKEIMQDDEVTAMVAREVLEELCPTSKE